MCLNKGEALLLGGLQHLISLMWLAEISHVGQCAGLNTVACD